MYQLKKTEVTCICDNVYVLTDRAGCCVNLVVGKEKALVFDTGSGTRTCVKKQIGRANV